MRIVIHLCPDTFDLIKNMGFKITAANCINYKRLRAGP